MIPDWMKESDSGPCKCSTISHAKKGFVRKTLDGILGFFQEAFLVESYSKRKGLLQSLDPRAKLISILALVLAMSLVRNLGILAGMYLLTLVLAASSNIGIGFFIKRVWLFIPLFTGVIAIPMIFNIFLPGDMLYPIAHLGTGAHLGPLALPESIYITRQGVLAASIFTMRVAACVSAVVLLFLTTPQQVLFKSLRSVGLPKLYVLTLEMSYRYIFLLMDIIRETYIAKKARTIRSGSTFQEQMWVGGRIGYMLIRSLDTSERVHSAMISRGFNGDVKIMPDFRMRQRDYLAGAVAITLSIFMVLASSNLIRV